MSWPWRNATHALRGRTDDIPSARSHAELEHDSGEPFPRIIPRLSRIALAGPHDVMRSLLLGASALVLLVETGDVALGEETVTALARIPASATTGEKPQSKVWFHAGRWWAVLPSTSVSPSGTWLWRLEADNRWTNVLRLSSSTSSKADTKAVEDVTHVLLHYSAPKLVSLEYVPEQKTYRFWTVRPTPTSVSLPDSETATIDIDSTGRMWLSTESGSNVLVYFSDYPYSTFAGPILLADDILEDDITVVAALPVPAPPKVGVLWSNQNTQRFGFRVHVDGDPPDVWEDDEVPASQSALHVGGGMADDHLNVAVASDGTLYAAVKTSYPSGFPLIALLLRRPDGTWDDLYQVDQSGTRGIVLLNEDAEMLGVYYTSSTSGGSILFKESELSAIAFGPRRTLMSGLLNNATSTKTNWTDQVVILAAGRGVLITRPTSTATTTTTTSTSQPPTTTTATMPLKPMATIDADVSVVPGDSTAYGKSLKLLVDNSPVKRTFLRFSVSGTGGHPLSSAILRLQAANVSGAPSDSKGRVHRSACGWSELTLTGSTQPQPPIDPAVLDAPPGGVQQGQIVEFNVKDAITGGDGTYCVALDTLSPDGVDYNSREADGGPAIVITVAP